MCWYMGMEVWAINIVFIELSIEISSEHILINTLMAHTYTELSISMISRLKNNQKIHTNCCVESKEQGQRFCFSYLFLELFMSPLNCNGDLCWDFLYLNYNKNNALINWNLDILFQRNDFKTYVKILKVDKNTNKPQRKSWYLYISFQAGWKTFMISLPFFPD